MRQEIITERDNSPVEVTVSAANVQSVRVSCSHGPMGCPFRKRSCRNGSQSRGLRVRAEPGAVPMETAFS
jgi:hypothetical protein